MKIKSKFYLYFILATTLPLVIVWLWTEHKILIIIPLLLFVILYYFVHKDFFAPLDNIGKQLIKHQEAKANSFSGMEKVIDNLINENQHLYDDMELMLDKQMQRLSTKTASLEILYNIVGKLNQIDDKSALFKEFLQVFVDMSGARGGIVRELTDNKMRLAAQINSSLADIEVAQNTPCSNADGVQFSTLDCTACIKDANNIGTVFIPLIHNHKELGAFALFFDKKPPSLAYDERMLIQAIADNVALYLDKLTQQENAKIAEIAKEKLYISQEIHDSLAQTIYSINLQISVMQGLAKNTDLQEKLTNLQSNIKQANSELRALIDNFRSPIIDNSTKKIQDLINDFKKETKIKIYLQIDTITLAEEVQTQIFMIISEALANIKKHAQAKNVRIVYNNKQLLIEDDGVGFDMENKKGHIGLQVMRERAERIGATLLVESEKDNDGTIIILNYENK